MLKLLQLRHRSSIGSNLSCTVPKHVLGKGDDVIVETESSCVCETIVLLLLLLLYWNSCHILRGGSTVALYHRAGWHPPGISQDDVSL